MDPRLRRVSLRGARACRARVRALADSPFKFVCPSTFVHALMPEQRGKERERKKAREREREKGEKQERKERGGERRGTVCHRGFLSVPKIYPRLGER